MTTFELEAAMDARKLSDAERLVIRKGYSNLVTLGWPLEHISMSMCKDDQRQFERWVDSLTLVDYQTRRARERLIDENANALATQQ